MANVVPFHISGERDEIHSKFSEAILQMQQKSSLKYMILERKINTMREELDVKEAQLHTATKGKLHNAMLLSRNSIASNTKSRFCM